MIELATDRTKMGDLCTPVITTARFFKYLYSGLPFFACRSCYLASSRAMPGQQERESQPLTPRHSTRLRAGSILPRLYFSSLLHSTASSRPYPGRIVLFLKTRHRENPHIRLQILHLVLRSRHRHSTVASSNSLLLLDSPQTFLPRETR